MPALLTVYTMAALSFRTYRRYAAKGGGIQLNKLSIGRTEVTQIDLGLPFGISGKLWRKKCREALMMMADRGIRYACLPPGLRQQGREYGLLPCEDRPTLRRLAADAALDLLGNTAEQSHVLVYARMPSREVLDCVHDLAERCRYVSAAGGVWAESTARMLLRNYGTASPGEGRAVQTLVLAFDPGCPIRGGEKVIDLTREGMEGEGILRPHTGAAFRLQGLPRGRFYDAGPLLGHLYHHGALERGDIRVWCRPTT